MAIIYFVEDDQSIAYIIEKTIEHAGFKGLAFKKGEEFLKAYKHHKPDMVLLDIMLPDMSGLDLLRLIRKEDSKIPIMMISALQSEMDKVIALDAGADDYMTKPFGVLELASRIYSKVRKIGDEYLYSIGNLKLDDKKHIISIADKDVYMTNKEFAILKLLLKQKGNVVSKEHIFKEVWETDFIGETRTLDMHIKSIRAKMMEHKAEAIIHTVRGIGYQIE